MAVLDPHRAALERELEHHRAAVARLEAVLCDRHVEQEHVGMVAAKTRAIDLGMSYSKLRKAALKTGVWKKRPGSPGRYDVPADFHPEISGKFRILSPD